MKNNLEISILNSQMNKIFIALIAAVFFSLVSCASTIRAFGDIFNTGGYSSTEDSSSSVKPTKSSSSAKSATSSSSSATGKTRKN